MITSKKCSSCSQTKSTDTFNRNIRTKDGRQPYCKDCEKLYRQKNIEHIKKRQHEYDIEYNKRNREKLSAQQKERNQTPQGKYKQYQHAAEYRNLEFILTFEEFMTFWQEPCWYCLVTISTVGLDRLDNHKGYKVDNLVSCCITCNEMKMDRSTKEFFSHLQKILKVHTEATQ